MDRVDPMPGLAPWLGGKRALAQRLVERIEAIPHRCYAEPFVGMGGVFLRRRRRPKVEAINDASRDVTNLFRVAQRHADALAAELRLALAARDAFERLSAIDPEALTDIERAARFLQLQYSRFGGKPDSRSFSVSPLVRAQFDPARVLRLLARAHRRLQGVYIERRDFEPFIKRFDGPDTLFFVDPPYYGVEHYYGRELFRREDFERLAQCLAEAKGCFLVTLNDRPEIRALFSWARIEAVTTTYYVHGPQRAAELIISR